MNTPLPRAAAPALALALLALACDSPAKTSADDETKAKKASKSGTEDSKADAGDRKAGAKDGKSDAKAGTTPKPTGKYRPGQLPPTGMSPEQIKEFARDVGDPTGGEFTLEQAFAGDPDLADKSKGALTASFDTTMGSFDCILYEDEAPMTVANFVGLARGKRATWDKKQGAWVEKNYFDGNIFHRVIKNFMIQTGDASNTGRGNPGYVLPDEFVPKLKHSAAGILSMANREKPNSGSTQFFITAKATHHLDGKHAVFGKCPDATVPVKISEVKVDHRAGDRPYEKVTINSVTISRQPKGKKKK